jgi:hypothetical protein
MAGVTMSAAATINKRSPQAIIAAFAESPTLDPGQLSDVQRAMFTDRCLTREESEALFRLEAAATRKCPGWVGFFNQTLTDYIIWQLRPTGVINSEQAAWLLAQDDSAQTLGSLALLVNIIAEAHSVPASFLHSVRARTLSRWPDCALTKEVA